MKKKHRVYKTHWDALQEGKLSAFAKPNDSTDNARETQNVLPFPTNSSEARTRLFWTASVETSREASSWKMPAVLKGEANLVVTPYWTVSLQ